MIWLRYPKWFDRFAGQSQLILSKTLLPGSSISSCSTQNCAYWRDVPIDSPVIEWTPTTSRAPRYMITYKFSHLFVTVSKLLPFSITKVAGPWSPSLLPSFGRGTRTLQWGPHRQCFVVQITTLALLLPLSWVQFTLANRLSATIFFPFP